MQRKLTKILATISSNTSLDETHSVIVCTNTTPINLTLPAVASCPGRVYTIKRGGDATMGGNVTIIGTIDGVSDPVLSTPLEYITIISNATSAEWSNVSTKATFPMGELSYFDQNTGTTIFITGQSDGSSNMMPCHPSTTFSSGSMNFDNGGSNTGRLRYTGATTKMAHVACTISAKSVSSSANFVFAIYKNGTILAASRVVQRLAVSSIQSTALHVMAELATNDYLELYVGNLEFSSGDMQLMSINLFALGM